MARNQSVPFPFHGIIDQVSKMISGLLDSEGSYLTHLTELTDLRGPAQPASGLTVTHPGCKV